MRIILKTGFEPVEVGTFLKNVQLLKGAQLVEARHISSLQEAKDRESSEISATVLPQMKLWEKDYQVEIQVSKFRKVTSAKCSCKAGISDTSVRVKEYRRCKLIEDMFPPTSASFIYPAKPLIEIIDKFNGLKNAIYPMLAQEHMHKLESFYFKLYLPRLYAFRSWFC